MASQAGATKPEKSKAAAAVAIALGLQIFVNTAKATVHDGAQLDAHDDISVSATVEYPFLIANPLSSINPLDYMKSAGPERSEVGVQAFLKFIQQHIEFRAVQFLESLDFRRVYDGRALVFDRSNSSVH